MLPIVPYKIAGDGHNKDATTKVRPRIRKSIPQVYDIMTIMTPSLIDPFHPLMFSVLKVVVTIGESLRS